MSLNYIRQSLAFWEQGRQAQHFIDFIQVSYGSIQTLADLRAKLAEDQEIDIKYRAKIREKLREAEEALQIARDKALKITLADGTIVLAYRDGNTFRFEYGSKVPQKLIAPGIDPSGITTFDKFDRLRNRQQALESALRKATKRKALSVGAKAARQITPGRT